MAVKKITSSTAGDKIKTTDDKQSGKGFNAAVAQAQQVHQSQNSEAPDDLTQNAQQALDRAKAESEQRISNIDAIRIARPEFGVGFDPITAYDHYMNQSRLDALNSIDIQPGETLGEAETRTGIDIGGDGAIGTFSRAQTAVHPASDVHIPAPKPGGYVATQNLTDQGITVEDFDHNDITQQDLKFDIDTRDTQFYGDQPISQRVPLGAYATGRLGVTTRVTEEGDLRVSYWAGARAHVAPVGFQAGISGPSYNPLEADRVFGRIGFSQEASLFGLDKHPTLPGQPKSIEQLADPKPSIQGGVTFQYDVANPDRPITIAVDYRAGVAIGGGDIGPDVMAEQAIEIQPYLETAPAKSSPNKPGDAIKADYYTERYYGGLVEQNGAEYLDAIGLTPERFQEISQQFAAHTNRSSAHVMSELSDTLNMAIEDFNEARQDYGLSVEDALHVSGSFQNGFQGTIEDIINAPRPAFKPAFPSHIPALKPKLPTYYPQLKPALPTHIPQLKPELSIHTPQLKPEVSTRNDTISVLEQRDYEMFGRRDETIQEFQARQDRESDAIIGGVKDFFSGLFSGNNQEVTTTDPVSATPAGGNDSRSDNDGTPSVRNNGFGDANTNPEIGGTSSSGMSGATRSANDGGSDGASTTAADTAPTPSPARPDISAPMPSPAKPDINDDNDSGGSDNDSHTSSGSSVGNNGFGDASSNPEVGGTNRSESDSDGGSGGSRVICTYFYQKGELNRVDWAADLRFTQNFVSSQTVRGYHFWAIPTVRLMRDGGLAGRLLEPAMRFITIHRANELAYRMGRRSHGDLAGKIIRWTMEPVCWAIGGLISEQDWQSLYRKQSMKA